MTERFDHRDERARAEDAAGPTVNEPVEEGAAGLRDEADDALLTDRSGDDEVAPDH